jgi:cell volume regulation protein A
VFVAGIVLGDVRAPYKAETERFHSSLASLGEIVAFTVLGATISLRTAADPDVWLVGLVLAVLLTLVVRPLAVFPLLLPVRLRMGERAFIVWAGLKGAVPILLGTFVLAAGMPGATRIYHIIFVVVAFSVLVQGSLVPAVARRCGVPMRVVEPEPWSSGMRFRHEPEGLRRFMVAAGSPADGSAIRDLALGEDVWISLVSRDGHIVQVRGDTVLNAGDEVLVLADPDLVSGPAALFGN